MNCFVKFCQDNVYIYYITNRVFHEGIVVAGRYSCGIGALCYQNRFATSYENSIVPRRLREKSQSTHLNEQEFGME